MGMYVSGGGLYKPARLDAWRNKLKADRRRRINQFAELLSQGYTITAAALEIGVSQQAGSQMMKQIREELGSQAD